MDYEQFLKGVNVSFSRNELVRYFLLVEQEFYKGWQHSFVFPGVIEALKKARERVDALRLITSRAWVEETRQEVKHFGLDQVFDRQVCTRGDLAQAEGVEEVPLYPYKEHRQRLINLAIIDLDTNSDVWVLGDSPSEMGTAKEIGYTTVGVLTGFYRRETLEPFCDYILNSAADINSII